MTKEEKEEERMVEEEEEYNPSDIYDMFKLIALIYVCLSTCVSLDSIDDRDI